MYPIEVVHPDFDESCYRKFHSCEDITVDLLDDIFKDLDKKLKVSLLLVDYTSAFDLLSIKRLVVKLKAYGL